MAVAGAVRITGYEPYTMCTEYVSSMSLVIKARKGIPLQTDKKATTEMAEKLLCFLLSNLVKYVL